MSDEQTTPETWIGMLERDGYVSIRADGDSGALLKELEPQINKGEVIGDVVNFRAEEWVVIFSKDFYNAHCTDAGSLNPLLRKAIEKIRDDLTFSKTLREDGKKAILLPGLDRPVGEFASEIADYYAARQTLFYRPETTEVVRIGMVKVDDEGHQILGLQPVNENAFVTYLEQDINLYALDGRGERHIRSIPAQTAKLVLASVDQFKMRLPIIKRILSVPIPRLINGMLKFPKKGYDPEFMSFVPEDAPEIKEMPLEDAKDLLLNKVYGEFAFKSPQDRVNAIAHLITPFCRGLFSRETIRSPLFIYLANREGSGKDYCAGVTSIVYQGEAAEDPPVTKADSGSDEEFRKKVIASFKIGRSLIHSSNNKGFLNSAELEALVTKEVYVDRQLGSNTLLEFPNTLTISLSANVGLTYPADLQRRAIFVNLFLDLEDPNTRVFKNPDLHGWVKEHRADLLSAFYALVKNWVDKGMPKSQQPFASFPEWMAVIGGILEAAGIGTPMQNDVLNSIGGDEETLSMKQLYVTAYEAWQSEWVSKSKIFSELQNPDSAFFGLFGYLDWDKHPESAKIRMGKLLSKYAGRIFADIRMEELKPTGHANRAQYRFSRIDDNVPTQQKFQNNEIENNNSLAGLAGLAGLSYEKKYESNNKSNNITIGEKPPILPNLPNSPQSTSNSNTLLDSPTPNPSFQENGNSNASASQPEGPMAEHSITFPPGSTSPFAMDSPAEGQGAARSSPQPTAPDPKIVLAKTALAIVKRSEEQNIPIDFDNLDPFNDLLDGFFVDDLKAALQRLERSGDIYSPREGYWKLVHAEDVDG
jgi:hypothetical protein